MAKRKTVRARSSRQAADRLRAAILKRRREQALRTDPEPSTLGMLGGAGEVAANLFTGGLADPIAGALGMSSGGDPNVVEAVRGAHTYEPRTAGGQQLMGGLQSLFEPMAQGMQALGESAEGAGPEAATAAYTAPVAGLSAIPFLGPMARRASQAGRQMGRQQGAARVSADTLMDTLPGEHPGLDRLSLSETPDTLGVNMIGVADDARRQGVGTNAMQDIQAFAEAQGKDVSLTPEAMPGGPPKSALSRFYRGLGFQSNRGPGRSFDTRDTMLWRPGPGGDQGGAGFISRGRDQSIAERAAEVQGQPPGAPATPGPGPQRGVDFDPTTEAPPEFFGGGREAGRSPQGLINRPGFMKQRGAGVVGPEEYRISSTLDPTGNPIVTPGREFAQVMPTAVGSEGRHLNELLDIDWDAWKKSGEGAKVAATLPNHPSVKTLDRRYGAPRQLQYAADQMQPRVQSFMDRAPEQLFEGSGKWYAGFNNLANQIARNQGLPTEHGAASVAALSPSTMWERNLEHALRLDHILRNQRDVPLADLEALMTTDPFASRFNKDAPSRALRDKVLQDKSRTAGDIFDLQDPQQSAAVSTAIDRMFYPKTIGQWDPAGQLTGELTTLAGNPAAYVPNSLSALTQANRALLPGFENASLALGNANKVRGFGQSGSNPDSPRSMGAMDTHAAGAAVGIPFGSGDAIIKQVFGSPYSKFTGHGGSYPLIHEVYNQVANQTPTLPRRSAAQSIPWEVKRQLMPSTPTSRTQAEAIWGDYRSGGLTNEQAIDRMWGELGL